MNSKEGYNKHPIQLEKISVLELSIKVNGVADDQEKVLPETGDFNLYHGHSDYDSSQKLIAVKAGASIKDDPQSPFSLQVELMGVFSVDDEKFPIDKLDDWAKSNAPLIIYPYLREHVYGLTSRAGFDGGVILPLFVVPTFKLERKTGK